MNERIMSGIDRKGTFMVYDDFYAAGVEDLKVRYIYPKTPNSGVSGAAWTYSRKRTLLVRGVGYFPAPSPHIRLLADALDGWSVDVYKMSLYHDLPVKLAYHQEIIEEMIHGGVLSFFKNQSTVTFNYLSSGSHSEGDGNRQERRKKRNEHRATHSPHPYPATSNVRPGQRRV